MKNAVLTWLRRNVLSHYLVKSVYIFGSFLRRPRDFGDVDIILIIKQSNMRLVVQRIKHSFAQYIP